MFPNKNIVLTACASLALAACSGDGSASETKAASAPRESVVQESILDTGAPSWDNIGKFVNRTAAESGLLDPKGTIGALIQQQARELGLDLGSQTVSFILREQGGSYYTGGHKGEDALDGVFFVVLRPMTQTVSTCIVEGGKTSCVHSDAQQTEIPADVLLQIDNAVNAQSLVAEGEEYMRKNGIDPLAPVVTESAASNVPPESAQ